MRTVGSVPHPQTVPAGGNILRFTEHRDPGGVSFHGGAIAPGLPVQLIFWGSWWAGPDGNALRATLEAKVQNLLSGPYTGALDQYGVSPPTYRGSLTVLDPEPPATYGTSDVKGLVWDHLIDHGLFPDPDEDGGRNGYFVMLPQGTAFDEAATAGGTHTWDYGYDFPADVDYAWMAVIPFAGLDTAGIDTTTSVFSHELVELVTDPEDSAIYSDALGHEIGEIGDMCQPNNNWELAYVNGVQVMAYWSNRDSCCIIPAGLFDVRIDGTIKVSETKVDSHGEQANPVGSDPQLCARYPDVCCLRGPYEWWSYGKTEVAALTATATGYQSPSFTWSVNGQRVNGTGTVQVEADVTSQTPTGTVEGTEQITLAFNASGQTLRLTNDSVTGEFDVTVAVETVDTSAKSQSGEQPTGTNRTATVPISFIGQDFEWSERYKRDLHACMGAAIENYVREHQELAVELRPGLINPGPIRESDSEILASLPASVSLEDKRQVLLILTVTEQIAENDPELADAVRNGLLTLLGVPASAGESVH
jgi:hypothetical protein